MTIQHEHAVKFDSTQVGSPQHLKDRYASGYELVAYLESADREPALGAYLHETLERAGCGCALAGLAAGVATYELQGERPLKHAFACLEDADARESATECATIGDEPFVTLSSELRMQLAGTQALSSQHVSGTLGNRTATGTPLNRKSDCQIVSMSSRALTRDSSQT